MIFYLRCCGLLDDAVWTAERLSSLICEQWTEEVVSRSGVTYYFLGGTEGNQQRRATVITGVRSKNTKVTPCIQVSELHQLSRWWHSDCFTRLDSVADIDHFMEYKDKCGLLSALQEKQKLRQLDIRGHFTRFKENCDLPECDTVRLIRFIPGPWRKLLSPSAVQKQFFNPENGRKITVPDVRT